MTPPWLVASKWSYQQTLSDLLPNVAPCEANTVGSVELPSVIDAMEAHPRHDPASRAVAQDVDPSARILSVTQAAQLYKFPLGRLLRRLDAGGVPGAFKRSDDGTGEWFIPENSLTALGYSPAEAAPAQETPAAGVGAQGTAGDDAPGGLGQLAGDLRRQAAADLTELEGERQKLDVERLKLAADRRELEAAFETLEEYRSAMEADMAKFEKVRARVDDGAKALAADRRRLTADSKRLGAESDRLTEQREELEAVRRQVEEDRLELRRRMPADTQRAPGERPARRRRKTPQPPSGG